MRLSSSINNVGPLSGLGESSFSKSSCTGIRNDGRLEPGLLSINSDEFDCRLGGMI